MKRLLALLTLCLFLFTGLFTGCEQPSSQQPQPTAATSVSQNGTYTSKEDVAAYLQEFGQLPSNFITKKEAKALGWESEKGNLWDVAPGKSIGGDRFGNYEGQLPDADGRKWQECDIDYEGGFRGACRLLYSSDGMIYYTDDHYETFTELKGAD